MTAKPSTTPSPVDAIVVGAGFSGMYMSYRLRELGLNTRVFEAGGDVGGTWYWNRYPGARCDIESMEYSYQFSSTLQEEWNWSERHATQPEILRYANHVADRFDLRGPISFNTRVLKAQFEAHHGRWRVETDRDECAYARFFILATGCLSNANVPRFPGQEGFTGEMFHTGRWPHTPVSFKGQRVGIIGTGSSGIQAIPHIAEQADALVVFQRTANYTIPAGNVPLTEAFRKAIKADYPDFRQRNRERPGGFGSRYPVAQVPALEATPEQREQDYEDRWQRGGFGFLGGFTDLWSNPQANQTAADFVRAKIRHIVKDPATAALLCPDQVIGCKRICLDTGYYETFNRPNVRLVDVKASPIEAIEARGLRTADESFELDSLVMATGFDAMSGSVLAIDIHGRGGRALRDEWQAGPRTYLGLGVAGFPNLFIVAGPGSPSVLSNMLVSIEQHVDWIADCVGHMQAHDLSLIEPTPTAQDEWVAHVNEVANQTLYPTCNSWYLGANIPGKARIFMPYAGGVPAYKARCDEVQAGGYAGFELL